MDAPEELRIEELTPDQLVNKLWNKRLRNEVIRALVGGLTGTELRQVTITGEVRKALIRGLQHPRSPIRWWCLQLIDHVSDTAMIRYVLPLLEDPAPRVRKMARHALTCERCKQDMAAAAAGKQALAEFDTR